MESNNLLEKLAFQVESFQKGFENLSGSRDFNEMTKIFAQLLTSSFSLKDVFILLRENLNSEWMPVGLGSIPAHPSLLKLDNHDSNTVSYYAGDEDVNAAVVIQLYEKSYLGILIGRKTDGTTFSDIDQISLKILLQLFDSAYKAFINRQKEKKLIFDLNEKVFQLNNLIDTGIELGKLEKRNRLYELALERVSSITNASSAMLKIIIADNSMPDEYFTFPGEIDPADILNSELKIESDFIFREFTYRIVLSAKETRHGLTSFTELDKLLLEAISRQLSASLENEFLHLEALEKERIEKELNLASLIQQQILPKELPQIDGYEIAGINIPSKEVGGDYYDCFSLRNGKYALIMADVAGKGIPASLLVNTLNASLYSYFDFDLTLSDMVGRLNKLICIATPDDKYITFFIAVLDPSSGQINVVNAGHNPILLLRKNGTLEKIHSVGLALGIFDLGVPYDEENIKLEPGDTLFLYTDGIPEAMNHHEEDYTDDRMIAFLKDHSDYSAKEFTTRLINDVREFCAGTPQSDDITLLLLKKI